MDVSSLQQITQNFVTDLKNASSQKESSLPYIQNTLPHNPLVHNNQPFQVIVVGGTVFKSALVTKNGSAIEILSYTKEELPPLSTSDIFLQLISQHLDPSVSFLALNFAYPLSPLFENGVLDGVLLSGKKEHAFAGLEGHHVGKTVSEYLHQHTGRQLTVSVANDTVCLTLGGLTHTSYENLAGGVIGSGLNFALFLDSTHVVNLEAGNFADFPHSPTGEIVIQQSQNPQAGAYEKEVSGIYLYRHFNILLGENHLSYPQLNSTRELNDIAAQEIPEVSELARQTVQRSAQLASCMIACILEYMQKDMTVVMEGSLFWKGYHYKETVEQTVAQLTHFTPTFLHIPHADVLGAAKLLG